MNNKNSCTFFIFNLITKILLLHLHHRNHKQKHFIITMKKTALLVAGLTMLASCGQKDKNTYTVTANLDEQANGLTAYIINFDNDEKIDSTVVTDGVAQFSGELQAPVMARLIVDGKRAGTFVLEADSITIANREINGGELNGKINDYNKAQMEIIEEFRNIPDSLKEAQYESFQNRISELGKKAIAENSNTPVGYYIFLQNAGDMSLEEIDAVIAKAPSLGEYKRIANIKQTLVNRDETSVGKKFKDFEVVYNDSTYRLSDYVGKGKYVLVDFWASWCGPCIRQTAVIKEILKEYGPKGLEVLGVAVWDKPEDTLEGIKAHKLPWTNIINAQNIPTDLYGISGIPCIILFSPDGTILSRDKQGDELKMDVASAMDNAK